MSLVSPVFLCLAEKMYVKTWFFVISQKRYWFFLNFALRNTDIASMNKHLISYKKLFDTVIIR